MLVATNLAHAEVVRNSNNVMVNNLIFKVAKRGSVYSEDAAVLCEDVFGRKPTFKDEQTIIVGFLDNKICATATLIHEENLYKMMNVVVVLEMQNKGIGSMLLKFCEDYVLENDVVAIYCHASDYAGRSAVNFFLKNQYFCRGERFEENGKESQIMVKLLVE
jgi:GNAT superfamily N-acetyltransferase